MPRLFCCYCKRQLTKPTDRANTALTMDHVLPKCAGGTRKVPCCRKCNMLKADLPPEKWREVTERFPRWWKLFDTHKNVREALVHLRLDVGP